MNESDAREPICDTAVTFDLADPTDNLVFESINSNELDYEDDSSRIGAKKGRSGSELRPKTWTH